MVNEVAVEVFGGCSNALGLVGCWPIGEGGFGGLGENCDICGVIGGCFRL